MTIDFVVLGTDTDVGKTTFSLLWLAAFRHDFEYWKPVEAGDSDSALVSRLVPLAITHATLARFRQPVSPVLAARMEGQSIPAAAVIAARTPHSKGRGLLIETFGSPLSPLNESELQTRLVESLDLPCVLVGSSRVGAIGRALQSVVALGTWGIRPAAVVLVGPHDAHVVEQIRRHSGLDGVFTITPPHAFEVAAVDQAATDQRSVLGQIRECLASSRQGSAGGPPAMSSREPPGAAAPRETERGLNAEDLIARDRQSVWHPYSLLREPDDPLVVTAAQDEFLNLADGRRIIDAISSWWTILHGHRHPVLMQALADAAQRLDHVLFAGITHRSAVELAERMLNTMPWQGGRVFFSDDGSTAVEVAIKMAFQYWCHRREPQRKCFVGFEGAYHGDTVGAMSVGRDPIFFGGFEPLMFHAERVPVSATRLDELLRRSAGEVAAVIIEPLVQAAGGMRMHSPEELRAIYHVSRQHNVLFIADEVMTGGGRTGDLWAHQTAQIAPDLVCAGKTIAGGAMPLAATLIAPHVVAAFDNDQRSRMFFHGHSFTAHPLACAVAAANWRLISNTRAPAAARIERFWTRRLAALATQPGVKEVRIRGTIAAAELDAPGGYLADMARVMRRVGLDHGVLLRPLGNVLYAIPPFCTSDRSLERIAVAMESAARAGVSVS